jgi:hypothetical protein
MEISVKNLKLIYLYILSICIILTSGTVVSKIAGTDGLNILLIILSLYLLVKYIKHKDIIVLICILLAFFAVEYSFGMSSFTFLKYLVKIFIVYLIVKYFRDEHFNLYTNFSKLIIALSLLNIVFYFLIIILNVKIPYRLIMINGYPTYHNYLYLFFTSQVTRVFYFDLFRNQSIFLEPGVYQIYLNFALLICLFSPEKPFKKEKYNLYSILVIIVNLLLTVSTMGLFLSSAIIFIKFLNFFRTIQKNKRYILLTILSVFTVAFTYFVFRQKLIFGAESYNIRLNDLVSGFKLFIKKPIIGWGYLNYDILNSQGYYGNSNGIISLLYQMGLIGFCFYFILLSIYIMHLKGSKSFRIGLLLFFVLSNFNEPNIYTNFMLLFIMEGFYEFYKIYICKFRIFKE